MENFRNIHCQGQTTMLEVIELKLGLQFRVSCINENVGE